MEQLEQNNLGGVILYPTQNKNKKRSFFFTWNNYSEKTLELLVNYWNNNQCLYMCGKEIGSKKQTKHLQGCFRFPFPRHWNAVLEDINNTVGIGIHLEECKRWPASIKYCAKELNYITNLSPDSLPVLPPPIITCEDRLKKYDNTIWRKWQQDILDLIQGDPDDRTVYWVFDEHGNSGKSFLAKYLALKYDAIVASGKTADIFNQINIWINKKWEGTKDPKLIILDIPRSYESVNYGAIEQIKNGMIYSGKYEGGLCIFDSPHVVVFSNAMPDSNQWSADRYNIINVIDQ